MAGQRTFGLASLLLAFGLIAVGCTDAELVEEIDQVSIRLESLQNLNLELEQRVEQLEDRVGLLVESDPTEDLTGAVSDLEHDVTTPGQIVGQLDDIVSDHESGIQDLRSCVNEYMDTIGDWSSNVNLFYTYFHC